MPLLFGSLCEDTNLYTLFFLFIYFTPYLSLKLPVLAAAPDIPRPFSRISPANAPIYPKTIPNYGKSLKILPFLPRNHLKPYFLPPETPENPIFPPKALLPSP